LTSEENRKIQKKTEEDRTRKQEDTEEDRRRQNKKTGRYRRRQKKTGEDTEKNTVRKANPIQEKRFNPKRCYFVG
jgi:hypothetical protein